MTYSSTINVSLKNLYMNIATIQMSADGSWDFDVILKIKPVTVMSSITSNLLSIYFWFNSRKYHFIYFENEKLLVKS